MRSKWPITSSAVAASGSDTTLQCSARLVELVGHLIDFGWFTHRICAESHFTASRMQSSFVRLPKSFRCWQLRIIAENRAIGASGPNTSLERTR